MATQRRPVPYVTQANTLTPGRWRAPLAPPAKLMMTWMHQQHAVIVPLGLSARRELWRVRCALLDRSAPCLAKHPAVVVILDPSRKKVPPLALHASQARTMGIAILLLRATIVAQAAFRRGGRSVVTTARPVKSTQTKMPVPLAQLASLVRSQTLGRLPAMPVRLVGPLLLEQTAHSALLASTPREAL